jgi:hypothetical protein
MHGVCLACVSMHLQPVLSEQQIDNQSAGCMSAHLCRELRASPVWRVTVVSCSLPMNGTKQLSTVHAMRQMWPHYTAHRVGLV